MTKLVVNKVAVLGAGVMGSQIAAHFANCNHKVYLYDLPGLAKKSLSILEKLKPNPLVTHEILERIVPCDYDNNLNLLSNCDWVIEAVAEDINIKEKLFNKVKSYINSTAIFSTNTSGLSINDLANFLKDQSSDLASRFLGVHFFNPPRYQKLVEIIPHANTKPVLVDKIEEYMVRYIGKGIVRAKDTPNFIANRIGVFSMLVTIHHALKFDINFDVVDGLTGELIGHAKSATFRTADVVGLDTLASVINTTYLKCKDDPWSKYLCVPDNINKLIARGFLGQKVKKGFYIKDNHGLSVFNVKTDDYQPVNVNGIDEKVKEILKTKKIAEKFNKLRACQHPQAQFLWAYFRDLFHYAAYHLSEIADNVRDVDNSLKWGFGWQQGPFEVWQSIGWSTVAIWLKEDINSNSSLSSVNLPSWVKEVNHVYDNMTAYNVRNRMYEYASKLSVYHRQYNLASNSSLQQKIVLENNDAKLWLHNQNLIFSFKTKANTINTNVLELLSQSLDYISNNSEYNNLVIWQDNGSHFCAGADISGFIDCINTNDYGRMNNTLKLFQETCQKIRYANFPVVAAVKGMALGGGCELLLHCSNVVCAIESYIGLVEVGLGVIPAGGGCKEMLVRAHNQYKNLINNKIEITPDKLIQYFFQNIAKATVSSSAHEALSLGYLRDTDTIIANQEELLSVAIDRANQLSFSNYQQQPALKLLSGGGRLEANILSVLTNYKVGEFISDHDLLVLSKLANVFSGGGVTSNFEITEDWVLQLEREKFIELLKTSKTKERIQYMLANNQPLRN